MSSSFLREMRGTRKARYGFDVYINSNTLVPIAKAIELARDIPDNDLYIETKINMGHGEVKFYTDRDDVADVLRKFEG